MVDVAQDEYSVKAPGILRYASWSNIQLKNDARAALDEVRQRDYPKAKSYSDVILSLINEHNHNQRG